MRVIVTARQTLTPNYDRTLQRLVGILGVISKNPSNPNFDQYIFESISALMRYESAIFFSFVIIEGFLDQIRCLRDSKYSPDL